MGGTEATPGSRPVSAPVKPRCPAAWTPGPPLLPAGQAWLHLLAGGEGGCVDKGDHAGEAPSSVGPRTRIRDQHQHKSPTAGPTEGQGEGTADLQELRVAHLSLELRAELDGGPGRALDSAGTKDAGQSGNLCVQ